MDPAQGVKDDWRGRAASWLARVVFETLRDDSSFDATVSQIAFSTLSRCSQQVLANKRCEAVTSRIYLLIKIFDQEEHADAFLQRGELFCRTLGDFKRDDDAFRGDKYEGITDWHQPDKITLTITLKFENGVDETLPIDDLAGPLITQNNGYDRFNLYCMYAVKFKEFEEPFETEEERVKVVEKINSMLKETTTLKNEVLSLGEFAVVVHGVESFVEMVKKSAGENNYACWNGLVGYYDPDTFHGSFTELQPVFRKRKIYEAQREYRFAFGSHEPEGTKVFHLGSLEHIAFKVPSRDITDRLQLKLVE